MNIFQIHRGIRQVGLNYGLPVLFIDCGLGMSLKPEDVVRKLSTHNIRRGSWVTIRNGISEKGLGILVDAIKYVGCLVEVETETRYAAPTWFPRADRWLVHWRGGTAFNLGALRKGHDLLICSVQDMPDMLARTGEKVNYDQAVLLDAEPNFDQLWAFGLRAYQKEN